MKHQLLFTFSLLLFSFYNNANCQTFTETFDANTGVTTTFTKTLGGESFTFTFTTDGNMGDMSWQDSYGDGNSASINLLSGSFNTSATELVTIKKTNGTNFTFNSIFINNTAGQTINVAGYLNGSIVGNSQTVATSASATLHFNAPSGITVNEVRISSTDFLNTNIDSFSGSTSTLSVNSPDLTLKLSVLPNPSSSVFMLSGLKESMNYKIWSTLGNLISEGRIHPEENVSIQNLKSGLYILQVGKNSIFKFVKK